MFEYARKTDTKNLNQDSLITIKIWTLWIQQLNCLKSYKSLLLQVVLNEKITRFSQSNFNTTFIFDNIKTNQICCWEVCFLEKKIREIDSNLLNYNDSVLLDTLLFDKSPFNIITTMLALYATTDFILPAINLKLHLSKLSNSWSVIIIHSIFSNLLTFNILFNIFYFRN